MCEREKNRITRGVGKESTQNHLNFLRPRWKLHHWTTLGPANGWFTLYLLFMAAYYTATPHSLGLQLPLRAWWAHSLLPWRWNSPDKWHNAPKLCETVMQTVLESSNFYVIKVTNISSSCRKSYLSPRHCEMWFELYFPGNDMMTGGYVIENEKVL